MTIRRYFETGIKVKKANLFQGNTSRKIKSLYLEYD